MISSIVAHQEGLSKVYASLTRPERVLMDEIMDTFGYLIDPLLKSGTEIPLRSFADIIEHNIHSEPVEHYVRVLRELDERNSSQLEMQSVH